MFPLLGILRKDIQKLISRKVADAMTSSTTLTHGLRVYDGILTKFVQVIRYLLVERINRNIEMHMNYVNFSCANKQNNHETYKVNTRKKHTAVASSTIGVRTSQSACLLFKDLAPTPTPIAGHNREPHFGLVPRLTFSRTREGTNFTDTREKRTPHPTKNRADQLAGT